MGDVMNEIYFPIFVFFCMFFTAASLIDFSNYYLFLLSFAGMIGSYLEK